MPADQSISFNRSCIVMIDHVQFLSIIFDHSHPCFVPSLRCTILALHHTPNMLCIILVVQHPCFAPSSLCTILDLCHYCLSAPLLCTILALHHLCFAPSLLCTLGRRTYVKVGRRTDGNIDINVRATSGHKRPQVATSGHKRPQVATSGHKWPQAAFVANAA